MPFIRTEDLQALQIYKDGTTYSQEKVNAVKQLLLRKYGNAGYYYAEVNVVPEINNETHIVDLNYYINPGQQVTVRRINFTGNTKTADEVLRREMRQMEGALASNEKIDLSKVRLERTGFFSKVDVKPVRVPNLPDQMDLNIDVEEQTFRYQYIGCGLFSEWWYHIPSRFKSNQLYGYR